MKNVVAIFVFLTIISIISCDENGNAQIDKIIGKWKLVKMYSFMYGSFFVDVTERNVDEYSLNRVRVVYDYTGSVVAQCDYHVTNSKLIYSGTNLNGEYWESKSDYWLKGDTLIVRADGGFEYTDAYWVRIE